MTDINTGTIEIKRRAGRWEDGRWVEEVTDTITTDASVQPITGNDLLQLPEARRTRRNLGFFTDIELKTADEHNVKNADVVIHRGISYEIHTVEDWSQMDLPHFYSIGSKIDGEGSGADN